MIFQTLPLNCLPKWRDRLTPLYLEHTRIDVDDSSVRSVSAAGTLPIPIATITSLLLGPGTSITHAAIKACASVNLPIFWVGEDSLHYYSGGASFTADNSNLRLQLKYASSSEFALVVARRLFTYRFPSSECASASLAQLRGMEGLRVRKTYEELGKKYRVIWKGRKYLPNQLWVSDSINRAITIANVALYAFCTSMILSLGFSPALGFIHLDGPLPFVYDVSDLVKYETSYSAAFQAVRDHTNPDTSQIFAILSRLIIQERVLERLPKLVMGVFDDSPDS